MQNSEDALNTTRELSRCRGPREESPAATIEALREEGLPGAPSSTEVGGLGLGLEGAAHNVRRVVEECGSTAMVLTMHYCGAAVLEAHSPVEVRRSAATAYVWSSKPVSAEGSSTLWLA